MPRRSTRRNLSAVRRHVARSNGREAEVAKFLAHHTDLEFAAGRRYMVRRDHLPEREVMTYGHTFAWHGCTSPRTLCAAFIASMRPALSRPTASSHCHGRCSACEERHSPWCRAARHEWRPSLRLYGDLSATCAPAAAFSGGSGRIHRYCSRVTRLPRGAGSASAEVPSRLFRSIAATSCHPAMGRVCAGSAERSGRLRSNSRPFRSTQLHTLSSECLSTLARSTAQPWPYPPVASLPP